MEQYAGIVIYRIQRSIEFLLVNDSFSNKRHWTPPKGKVIGQEDELKCAIREVIDLTGLSAKDIHIEDNFRAEIKYLSGSRPKSVVYYLAQISQNGRIIPTGLAGLHFAWWPLQTSCDKAMYKSMQDVLKQAQAVIEDKRSKMPPPTSATLPLNLQKLHSHGYDGIGGGGYGGGGGSNRSDRGGFGGIDKRFKQMSMGSGGGANAGDDNSRYHHGGSPGRGGGGMNGRHHNGPQDNRSMVFAPNGNRGWRRDDDSSANAGGAGGGRGGSGFNSSPAAADAKAAAANSQNDNPLYKTRLCERYETEGFCPYGSRCTFAHGTVELRDRPTYGGDNEKKDGPENPLYKTRLCERFMKENFCQYGPRCNFAHSELRDRPTHGTKADGTPAGKENLDLPTLANGPAPGAANPSSGTSTPPAPPVPPTLPTHPPPKSVSPEVPPPAPPVAEPKESLSAPRTPVMSGSRKEKKDEKVSLKDLLSGEQDKDRTWMRVVELSEVEREKLGNINKTTHFTKEKQSLEETLTRDLHDFFASRSGSQSGGEGGKTSSKSLDKEVAEQVKEITRVEFRHDLSKQQLFNVLVPALFDEGFTGGKLHARTKLLRQFIHKSTDQLFFLRSWEKYMLHHPGVLAKAPLVFKSLYDEDLVDEDVFLK
ncbi:nudix (nucleoside diphosphate linked moiety X)-type motif 2, partial [Quaeritorhiza haematococci]